MRASSATSLLLGAWIATSACGRVGSSETQEWPVHGGDPGSRQYSSLADITANNVRELNQVWEWRPGESETAESPDPSPVPPGRFQATPIMVGDTLYLSTPLNQAVALDAETGRELWRFDPGVRRWPTVLDRHGVVHRGVAIWSGPRARRVFLNSRWRLFALDATTGEPVSSFGTDGAVDLTAGLRWAVDRLHLYHTSPPVVFENLVIVGSSVPDRLIFPRDPPGDVQAFDAETGERVWVWSPLPAPGEVGSDTWEADGGGIGTTGHMNVWATMTLDTARGLLFLPVSAASNDWYGGARKGDNLFAESLVCLDARTGRRRWHFQLIHHGLWDYDPAAAPVLVSLRRNGREVDAVALAGKTGFLYLFERETGRPIWPIVERPVPASDVPGEAASPTQPFPTWPEPFAKQGFGREDLVDFTPELRKLAEEAAAPYQSGPLFTPPSVQGTIVMPGWIGGAGWGSVAFDPESRMLYVKATNQPTLGRLVPGPRDSATVSGRFVLDFEIGRQDQPLELELPADSVQDGVASVRLPISKPPYGTLTAISLDTGERAWQVVLGDTPALRGWLARRGIDRGPLGVAGTPGPMVTGGDLLFVTGGGTVLYALDKQTGAAVWSHDLRARAYSVPMTYRTRRRIQYVVVAVGFGATSRLVGFAPRGAGGRSRSARPPS